MVCGPGPAVRLHRAVVVFVSPGGDSASEGREPGADR
jgi:hypothetical protein